MLSGTETPSSRQQAKVVGSTRQQLLWQQHERQTISGD
jgi:hypothetical protein